LKSSITVGKSGFRGPSFARNHRPDFLAEIVPFFYMARDRGRAAFFALVRIQRNRCGGYFASLAACSMRAATVWG
jgi:hypothetical protein